MNKRDARRAWVASLKVGDEVAIVPAKLRRPEPGATGSLAIVVEIISRPDRPEETQIKVDQPELKRLDRFCRSLFYDVNGYRDRFGNRSCIVPITDEMRRKWHVQAVEKRVLDAFATRWRPNGLTDNQLLRIGAILDEPKEGTC